VRHPDTRQQWRTVGLADGTSPGGGNPPGFVVVYGLDDRSGCIDAFAINAAVTREPTVRIYADRAGPPPLF